MGPDPSLQGAAYLQEYCPTSPPAPGNHVEMSALEADLAV